MNLLSQWWVTPTNIPPVAITSSMFDGFTTSIKLSLGAISGKGLVLLGVCLSVLMIGGIFRELLLDKLRFFNAVKKREFQRKVTAEDRQRNLDAIIEESAGSMVVSHFALARFREWYPDADLEEKIYQRQISHQADLEFHRRNPEAYGEEQDFYRAKAAEYYNTRITRAEEDKARRAGKIVAL